MTLEQIIEEYYKQEINIGLVGCWDGGYQVSIDTEFGYNGIKKPEEWEVFETLDEVKDYLITSLHEGK